VFLFALWVGGRVEGERVTWSLAVLAAAIGALARRPV
jgi:hypothetical protein